VATLTLNTHCLICLLACNGRSCVWIPSGHNMSCFIRLTLLTLSNPIFLPPAYSSALIYFGRERGWWITCNYPTVLKEKNRNWKSKTCAVCWLKSVLHEEKRGEQENHNVGLRPTLWFSSCSTDLSQQIAQVVLFLFMFFSFKTVG
jgi:hypothetical protein